MSTDRPSVSLGFTEERFPAGVHICQVFSDDDERQRTLLNFVRSGLADGEAVRCFSNNITVQELSEYLEQEGLSYSHATQSGALGLCPTREVYFQDERFEPERMLTLLEDYYQQVQRKGHRAGRVIGEMSPEVQHITGGCRLLEYESRVSLLLRDKPITSVCQYDARLFDGAMILDILKVHPLMLLRGFVVHNPFFVPPEIFLGEKTRAFSPPDAP